MKKILILFFLIFCSITLKAQLNGNGSYGLPYNGTFEGDLQWTYANFSSGKIYLNGDVTIDDELLSVEAGTSIIFLAEGADLIITGTGSINASGADGNNIFFTADDDNDGNYGEAGERWGRIVFLNSTGTSVLNYCDISFGSNIGSGFAGYGGGIYISTNYLTLSNSVIHNNTATFGGGIYVNDYSGQTINNCRIYSNSATASGGGLYLSYNSFSTVTNCIISNNVCTNTGDIWGGGGLGIYTSNGNTRLINCTIANNNHQTPYSKRGNDILIKSSNPSFRFVNSIVWGSNDYSVFIESTPISTNFINSAIRRVYNASGEIQISSYTNCFNLNSSNTASNGPNFNAIDGSDWSINFISPCRDAGTTPSPTVPNDFIGNSRIGPYDIGAYEV
ncbi:MAG: right-handed parallel beta-helix repeat-containing protein, partial [Ignavibacteria bacterium]|nr:right-handed parallel beta-helix repeat-containing protein [Ignavibacteria bacterium]